MSEAGYECLRDALTIAKGVDPPKSVSALKARLVWRGHQEAAIKEALASWAGSVVTRLTEPEEN